MTEFAALTGVSRERLRTWERRHGFPGPVRVGGGRRRYLAADVGRVVAVRRAAEEGVPLAVAIEQSAASAMPAVGAGAFEAAVERAPVPVALVSGPAPLRLEHANAALRAVPGAPAPGAEVEHLAPLREHFTRDLPPGEVEHSAWGGSGVDRSLAYRLPAGPGEPPMVAVVGIGSSGEREARRQLAARDDELALLRRRAERHDRWLDAIAGLAQEFQHEPGPDVIGSALDVLIRQTRAVDGGLASYVSGRLALRGSHRGLLDSQMLLVAAHPELGRALRDHEGVWLDDTVARLLGVPADLHAAGIPVTVAGDPLGLLVMVFEDVEPHDRDNRRLLAAISAAVGFALLRDRLVRELRAAVSPAAAPPALRAAGGRPPAG